jgi:hypothetical protein
VDSNPLALRVSVAHWAFVDALARCFRASRMGGYRRREYLFRSSAVGDVRRSEEDLSDMAQRQSGRGRSIAVRAWANIGLSEDDKKAISGTPVEDDYLSSYVGDLVLRGYRFSLTFDDYSQAVQATLVCADPDDPNFELGMSARHPDPKTAVQTLLYKHHELAEENWGPFVGQRAVSKWD